ncbi:MAG: c-type cytochrome [Vicinamibacterales bacterium]
MRRRWFSRLVTVQCLTLSGLTLSGLPLAGLGLQARGADTVWDGVYSAAQAARGEKAYMRACGGCHRDDASGGDDSEPPLRGPNFTSNWEGASVAVLYDFIATNMPRTRPGSVPLEECVDIVAFLLKLNEMPEGTRELTTDIKALAAIRFTATKPAR